MAAAPDEDIARKGRRSLAGAAGSAVHAASEDILNVSFLLAHTAFSYYRVAFGLELRGPWGALSCSRGRGKQGTVANCAHFDFLEPLDSVLVWSASLAVRISLVLFLASWAGVVYHGPGRVPRKQERGSDLPPAMVAAFEVGKFNTQRPFCASDGWCDRCDLWKPVLAHHCKLCQQCAMWMDHHCTWCACCIGFRNFRCFIVFLCYGQVYSALVTLLAARYTLSDRSGLDSWSQLRLLIFWPTALLAIRRIHVYRKEALWRVGAGWCSGVLMLKFEAVMEATRRVADSGWRRQDLIALACRLYMPGGLGVRGPLGLPLARIIGNLATVFGEPPCPRWLLPCVPGGSGDPTRPGAYDAEVCADWAALCRLLEEHRQECGGGVDAPAESPCDRTGPEARALAGDPEVRAPPARAAGPAAREPACSA
ncbi:unnamed protein product [Prorocentrum cordatum]|uniref:Palmitoyltransferase n=1 Tax=Prorocentrum cordatum TaxID=2364126 RepID=A0ABN9S814_9DINO|nr:unnamed protein product [Polarella glacialis]